MLAIVALSLTCIPSFGFAASASQPDPVQLSHSSLVNSASVGFPVRFNGTISGGEVATIVCIVVGPEDGPRHRGPLNLK
jgi:hypothetical protein